MFKKLEQVQPPYFEGGVDPTFLENWIREFDNIFTTLNCPVNMRVDQASMYLKEEADIWWRDNGNVLRAEANFGWETFKTKLREKFYPPFLRKQKAQEFINLQMNNMSITEYYNKFMNLSRFTPEVVPTESALESGSVGEKRKDFGNSSDQGNFKKPRNENFQNRNVQNNGGSSRPDGQAERHYNCKRCGKDHPGKDYDGNLQQGNGNKFTPTSNQGENSNGYNGNGKNGNVGNNSGNQGKNVTTGRFSVMNKKEAKRSSDVVTGNFSVHSISIKALFDSGATYSFIYSSVVKQ
ncbi:basic-leucine zipper transcription factor A-like [Chenopodium quinoa]|uniref:basic-leucine zipper transcription factor A-like n=1 Tax=Chenopodium quinoa TaxID=63459 RepID=UPI000B778444|nr:basic-leucine zipper transcription factor A-like [Chenopodium quinoa]